MDLRSVSGSRVESGVQVPETALDSVSLAGLATLSLLSGSVREDGGMTSSIKNKRVRWAVPIVAALAVGAAVAFPTISNAGTPNLPEKSAEQLLTDIASAEPHALSGTLVSSAHLGLPDISALMGIASSKGMDSVSPVNLLTGSTTVRVWADPAQGARASLLGSSAEYSAVATPENLWTYSSSTNTATHYTVTGADAAKPTDMPTTIPTPATIASQALAALDPTTEVTVDPTVRVAGRDCYQLLLKPKDPGSLIGSIRIAIDAETSTPLRAQVWAAADGDQPSYELAFTDVSFETPAASVFDFVPPAGATVEEKSVDATQYETGHEAAKVDAARPDVTTVGTGWATVAIISGASDQLAALTDAMGSAAAAGGATEGTDPGSLASAIDPATIMSQVGKAVPEGTLFTTNLFSALLTTDGRLLIGAVPGETLQAAAR